MSQAVEYRAVVGWPAYRVGDDGSVWTQLSTGRKPKLTGIWRQLKPSPRARGYLYVTLCELNGERRQASVGSIVLEAFVGPRPDGMEVCHFPDRDVSNNARSNVRWGTRLDNIADKEIHGTVLRGTEHPNSVLTDDKVAELLQLRNAGRSIGSLAKQFNISKGTSQDIIEGRTWQQHIPR